MADQSEAIHLIDAALVRLLPPGSSLCGTVTSDTPQQLLLEGSFDGRMELPAESRIVIAATAEVNAEILRANTVVVRGRVTGHIQARVVEISSTAIVSGAVKYDFALSIAPGARIRASIEGPED